MKENIRRRLISGCFFTVIVVLTASSVAYGQSGSSNTDGRRVSLYVTDRSGRPVTGLAPEDIEVTIGGSAAKITGLTEIDEPWSMLFVIDDSGSVQNDPRYGQLSRFWEMKIKELAESGHAGNEYGVIVFAREVEQIMNWTPYGPGIFDRSLQRLHEDRNRRGSALYDAIHAATGMFGTASRANRAIIVIGDGGESTSEYTSLNELIKKLRTNGIIVFTVNILELFEVRIFPGANVSSAKVFHLDHIDHSRRYEQLARDTGGINIVARRNDDIHLIFQTLNFVLRSKYRIELDTASIDPLKAGKDLKVKIVSRNSVLRKLDLLASYRAER